MKRFSLTIIFILICFCSAPECAEYNVGDGDVLKISVYGQKDLEIVERVSGSGDIIYPLLGQVHVSGLSVPEISRLIANGLADGYIVSPQVSVFVIEFRSQKVVIMGEIVKPGLYEMKGRTTLLELISLAGGLTKDAGDKATIKRVGPDDRPTTEVFDLTVIFEGSVNVKDIELSDGSSVFISKAGSVYITGEVNRPGAYKYTDGTTVLKAITLAGGFNDRAADRKVKIIRIIDGVEKVLESVPMDEPVLPDDVVVIPESLF